MDTNKVSNLFKYLKDKYGEESIRLHRFWEITIKKMVDYRNHRTFMLRCIRLESLWSVVELGTHYMLKQQKVIILSRKLKDNYCMKGLETLPGLYKCMSIISQNFIPS